MSEQPKPTKNDRPAVWDLVIEDMKARDAIGQQRYGTRLQPFNGRDSLQDAYEEALDLAVYLRQAIEERRNGPKSSAAASDVSKTGRCAENSNLANVVLCATCRHEKVRIDSEPCSGCVHRDRWEARSAAE